MSAKQFFKGTAFKCIVVLLSIVLICGVLLTICNSLFFVSAEEKLARAFKKLYGEEVAYETQVTDDAISITDCKINDVYKITTYDGDYLINATGAGGYSNGTVTCWVIVTVKDGAVDGVKNVSIASNVGQSFITKVTGSAIEEVIGKQDEAGFTSYNTENIKTGATFSLGAVANAMNGAVEYVNAKYCGNVSKFADFAYSKYIDETTTVTVADGVATYTITTKTVSPTHSFRITIKVDATKKITAYTITENGSTTPEWEAKMSAEAKNLVGKSLADIVALVDPFTTDDGSYDSSAELKTNATKSNFLCYTSGAFATANYDKVIELGGVN